MLKYEQIRVLGQGGFGKAILARKKNGNKNKEEKVVIKEVQIFSLKPRDREVAFQEAKLLSTLKNPFIVSYIESFQERGNLYIVMEYADGGDLAQKVEQLREKRSSKNNQRYNHSPYAAKNKNSSSDYFMTEEEVLHYFIQISLAIKYIHDRKILHRDLKTQNIFLMKDGTTKLGDFGIARVLQNTFQLCKTQIGTPYYLSPELCEGKNYNSKTDIWSLGCILYELCTLNRAFDGNNMNQLIVNIIRGKHKPIDSAHYSSDLRNLVDSMLTKDPSKRPSINQILRQPFIKDRLSNFLNEKLLNYEMQHTILHGRKPFAQPTLVLPQNSILIEDKVEEKNKEKEKKVKSDIKKNQINLNKNNLNKNANAKVDDFDPASKNAMNHKEIETKKQLIEAEKKKLSLAQQKRLEYEEKLKQAHERRQRKLQQEAEEKERKLKEIQIQEKVKKSLQEKNEVIHLPKRKRYDELQIDEEERRRIYLEQKQEMLRNKRRHEQDQQSIMKAIYGNDQVDPNEEQIKKQKKLEQMRQERLNYLNRRERKLQMKANEQKNDNDNNNNDDDIDKQVDFSSQKAGLSKSIRRLKKDEKNKDEKQVDMSEFYRQQRREAKANKKRLDAALGIKDKNDNINNDKENVDMDELIKEAEADLANKPNDNIENPSPINKPLIKRKKQKDISIEFIGMPKQDDNDVLKEKIGASKIKRSRSAFDKGQQFSPSLKNKSENESKQSSRKIQPSPPASPILKPKVGASVLRSPSETRGSRSKSHLNSSIPIKKNQNGSKVDNNNNNSEDLKTDQGEIEIETEIKMQNAIDQASAIVDALEISTDYNDNEVDDFDDPFCLNQNLTKTNNKNESEISEFNTKEDFNKGESIPLILKDKTMDFPVVKDSDSLAYRAEAIRAFLEKDIGIDKLIKLYRVLSNDNNTNDEKYEKYVEKNIAESGVEPGYILLIQQLIVLDEKVGML